MKIDGKTLAQELLVNKQQIIPTLAIIKAGNDPASDVYIAQKRKAASLANIRLKTLHFSPNVSAAHLAEVVNSLNIDTTIHGIIIQRPLPPPLTSTVLKVALHKDVDGFEPHSPFIAPVARAVLYVLETIYQTIDLSILNTKRVLIIGKGATAGKPIANAHRMPLSGSARLDMMRALASVLPQPVEAMLTMKAPFRVDRSRIVAAMSAALSCQ